ncbi:hypothetical protein M0813_00869 [Anaeramoeba flamelloides]|uniref:Uncharacterized protein n=1 Tax=Anaeramoeba flamelloides TaxID=1746091 RepID=A0ABQ8XEH6_9EUKA|nr:hypothetical protein M0813_00869 [Anaeramoeba flamelloides]
MSSTSTTASASESGVSVETNRSKNGINSNSEMLPNSEQRENLNDLILSLRKELETIKKKTKETKLIIAKTEIQLMREKKEKASLKMEVDLLQEENQELIENADPKKEKIIKKIVNLACVNVIVEQIEQLDQESKFSTEHNKQIRERGEILVKRYKKKEKNKKEKKTKEKKKKEKRKTHSNKERESEKKSPSSKRKKKNIKKKKKKKKK